MESMSLNANEHFGKQLREFRIAKGLTQVTLAKKMGCRSDNISHFEKGDNTFGKGSLQTVFKYAKALGYTQINFQI